MGPDEIGVRGVDVLGGIESTEEVLERTGATGVVISLSSVASDLVNRLTRQLTDAGYHVALSSGLRDIDVARFRAQDLGGQTLVYVEQTQRRVAPSPSGSSTSPLRSRRWCSSPLMLSRPSP